VSETPSKETQVKSEDRQSLV